MGKAEQISGIFWMTFGAVIAFESWRLGLGSLRQPGPGFLNFWAGLGLAGMALADLIQTRAVSKGEQPGKPAARDQNTRKILPFLVSVFLYAALMETLGFILVTFLLFLFLLGVIERKHWRFTIPVSIAVTAVSYLIFEVWLMSQLPRGILDLFQF
jgi:putative tricarboxylic transport membrane protein